MKVCCVCNKARAAYKCPTCKSPYCSIACCNEHKSSECSPPQAECSETNVPLNYEDNRLKYNFTTEDTVPIEKLRNLRQSENVRTCLENPHVRDIMQAILNDSNPTKAIALAMAEPIFVELADACLKVVELPDEDKPC